MKDIEQFLRENKPAAPEEGQFLLEANARLERAEGIKRTVDGDRHRGRLALVLALAIGLAAGCMVTLFVFLYPAPRISFDGGVLTRAVAFLAQWKVWLLLPVAALAIALGLVLMPRSKEV